MHTASDKQRPVITGGFQQRGLDMTRIETFTDAAFAFSLTLLVISFDAIPTSYEEMIEALKRIPAFAASFAQISLFWYAHHRWSRRMGLDDMPTVVLSLMLVFFTLVYVFPLRLMFSAIFSLMTNNYLPYEFTTYSYEEMGTIFFIYGLGFIAMSAVICLLYVHALRQRTILQLTRLETFLVRGEIGAWCISILIGLVSCTLAMTLPDKWSPLSGFAYLLFPVLMPIFGVMTGRRLKQIKSDNDLQAI